MEESLIDAISRVLPDVDVYHDFAPEEAEFPLVIVQRVGGAVALGGVAVFGVGELGGKEEGEEERGFHWGSFWGFTYTLSAQVYVSGYSGFSRQNCLMAAATAAGWSMCRWWPPSSLATRMSCVRR